MISFHSLTQIKAHFAEMIKRVQESRNPLVVTQNGNASVVIIDHDTFQPTQDALHMLALVSMSRKEIAKGEGIPQDEVFRDLRARLKSHQ